MIEPFLDNAASLLGQQISLNKPIVIKWQTEITKKLDAIILNNKEEKVAEILGITKNAVTFNQQLQPGLYYWKLQTKDDLVYLGKFYVR